MLEKMPRARLYPEGDANMLGGAVVMQMNEPAEVLCG
jgi:hypothetical protein